MATKKQLTLDPVSGKLSRLSEKDLPLNKIFLTITLSGRRLCSSKLPFV